MAFLFPPQSADSLDSPQRLRHVPIHQVLRVIDVRPGQRLLDLGCGTGTFFFPAFEAMQGKGVFIAAELQEEMLNRFMNRLDQYQDHQGYSAIEVLRAKPDRLPLPAACVDRVMMIQVYHEIEGRPRYLQELRRVLAPGGLLCLVDWRGREDDAALSGEAVTMGPPLEQRVTEKEAVAQLQDAGFGYVVSHSGFPGNWCLTVRSPL